MSTALQIKVDESDAWVLTLRRWGIKRHTTARRTYHYVFAKIGGKHVLLHRLLMQAPPGAFVDHINGDGLDNRRQNLRLCSHAENMRNRRMNEGHAHGFKGVGFRKGRFYAQIKSCGVRRFRGGFATAEEAAAVYVAWAQELHGQFACVGIVEEAIGASSP